LTHPLRSMNDIVDALVYDFTHFNLPDFINTLQHQRQRRIQVTGWSLTDDLFGVWIPATSADYIFYNQTRHPVHQTHTVLHLLAHLVLDHPPYPLTAVPALTVDVPNAGRLYAAFPDNDDTQAADANRFAAVVQQRVLTARRFDELYRGRSSVPSFRPYVDGLSLEASR
jgi:hypothetical protein